MSAKLLSKQELLQALDVLSQPIDFEKLEKTGILKRKGSGDWSYVLKPDKVPHHVNMQATEIVRSKGEPDCIKLPKLTRTRVGRVNQLKKQIQGEL